MDIAEIIGLRLKQARKRAKLSLEELCDRMDGAVSKQTILNYEKGETSPSYPKLERLSEALGMPLDFFFRPVLCDIENMEVSFREKSTIGKRDQAAMKVAIQDEVERFMQLVELTDCEPKAFVPVEPARQVLRTRDDMEECARKVRREWGLGTAPISSVQLLLEDHGVRVIRTECTTEMDGVSARVDGKPFMVLNGNVKHCERQRLTALHELAHLLYNDYIAMDIPNAEKEKMCHAFANEMLLPTEVVREHFGGLTKISLYEAVDLQRAYGISVEAVMLKLNRAGIVSNARYKSFCMMRRSNERVKHIAERSLFTEEELDTFESRVYGALARGLITELRAAALLNVSATEVHDKLNAI